METSKEKKRKVYTFRLNVFLAILRVTWCLLGLSGQSENAQPYAPFYGQPKSLNRPTKHGLISIFYSIDRVTPGIFGVPLATSITYANVAISLFNDGGESYIYGYVPIVVAKCGVYLKEKG